MTSERVSKLLQEMTTEEKIGQLLQLSADFFEGSQAVITGPMREHDLTLATVYTAGSVLGISGAERVHQIQADYLAKSRLKIPLLFMADIVHGFQTIFPIPLGMAASFDPEAVKLASEVAARESAVSGLHVTFAPMVDLVRDPRWGRVMESTGEDPYLNSVLAKASVDGFQGDLDVEHIAACVKHFAAYGAPEAGREYNTVDLSEWRFREQYLPAYSAAIAAQAKLVMTSFNTLFGVPATANQHLFRDILRDELAFKGVVISDWDAIGELINHGVAGNLQAAADQALAAGVDIDMMSFAYAKYLQKAANLDESTRQLIDESTARILELKESLGLFTDPYRQVTPEREQAELKSVQNLNAAQQVAEESIVLLKNERAILPLARDQKLALIGPVANTGDLLGSWSWQGDQHQTPSIYTAMAEKFPQVSYASGCAYHQLNHREFDQALSTARQADKIIAVLGLPSSESGEATSMTDIRLPQEQLTLLQALAKLGKPIISVVVTGRPLDLTLVDDLSAAVVLAWFPGSRGAAALTNILSGAVNPSGKLPMTFPRSVGQVPIYYNQFNTGRPLSHTENDRENKYLSKYIDEANSPLYPFGFGLSYAEIKAQPISATQQGRSIQLKVELENTAALAGKTVVQCYLHQPVATTVQPVQRLVAFSKVLVPSKQKVELTLTVAPEELTYLDAALKRQTFTGELKFLIGLDSQHTKAISIAYQND